MLRLFAAIFMVSFLSGCFSSGPQYLAQPQAITMDGSYIHQPSGIMFPVRTGEFQRMAIYQFDAEGQHISVGYNRSVAGKPVAVTVYVYPSPSIKSFGSPQSVIDGTRSELCQHEFAAHQYEITNIHPDARLIRDETSQRDNQGYQKLFARFSYEDTFAGMPQALWSELQLSCYINDKWDIKYRVTYPQNTAVDAEIQKLKQAIENVQYDAQ